MANAHSLGFLATSGHHGGIKTLGELECGVDINLRQLNSVVVRPDGETADIQGGVLTREVTNALWSLGKWTGKEGPHGRCHHSHAVLTRHSHGGLRMHLSDGPGAWRGPRLEPGALRARS